MLKRTFIHPILFALFPVLFLYAQNATEMRIGEIFLPIFLAAILAALIYFGLRFVVREPDKRAMLSSLILLSFFSYGHFISFLDKSDFIRHNHHLASYLFVILLATLSYGLIKFLRKRKKKLVGVTVFLNRTALILVLIQLAVAATTIFGRDNISKTDLELSTEFTASENLPDIYYIILDGYGRADILKEQYNYDNSEFLNGLKELGFFIADSSYSNYCATVQSLASSLNFDYLHTLAKFDSEAFDRTPLSKMMINNRLFPFLKKFGYKSVSFESGHTPAHLDKVDYYFHPGATLSEFQNILINTTPIFHLLNISRSQFAMHRTRISYLIDKIPDLNYISSPKIVFGHLISPHPPFVFGENGEPKQRSWPFAFSDGDHYTIQGGTKEEYISGYRGQLKYISKQILSMIKKIIANSENDPIIIIQGDHGPGSELFWQSLPNTNIKERFSILNAYYLPGLKNKELLTADLSPVNSFRLILREYFRADLELLDNHQYFTTRTRPYKFLEVTRELP